MSAQVSPQLNPGIILETLTSHQRTQALKAAIELELFTHIADGAATAAAIAPRCQASEKGIRVLCDYLTMLGFLTKSGSTYGLSPDSAAFLNKHSPTYMGTVAGFLAHPAMVHRFENLADIVRNGGALDHGTLAPDDPVWVEFARNMAPMMMLQAQAMAEAVSQPGRPEKVLDVAAGHGIFGLMVAKRNAAAQVHAVDWAPVLEVAKEHAAQFGVLTRYHTIPGSAFEADLGSSYDIILLPNFLHHFDPPTNVKLLKRLRAALKPGGVVATVEFVPNEDRISPFIPAAFSLMMLGGTPSGDAYTFPELDKMFREAGFGASEIRPLTPAPQQLILTR